MFLDDITGPMSVKEAQDKVKKSQKPSWALDTKTKDLANCKGIDEDSWHGGNNAWSSENNEISSGSNAWASEGVEEHVAMAGLDQGGSESPIPGTPGLDTGMTEERLNIGDPIIVTAPNAYEGKTGDIVEFSPSGRFVIVRLYNHGEHSMHLSDVEYNQYADEEDELDEDFGSSPVTGAITRRILSQRLDLLKQYGPELVGAAVDNVADYVGDVEEIGSSDVSAWVNQVERMLKENPPEAFAEEAHMYRGPHGHVDVDRKGGVTRVTRRDWDDTSKATTDVKGGKYFPNKDIKGQGTGSVASNGTSSLHSIPGGSYRKTPRLDHDANDAPNYDVDEGWQDFNKVEPYAVCLAGKPVKKFDYYEDARRFHDNWKKKLYNAGEKEKADKITLNPIMDEAYTPSPAKPFRNPPGFNKQGTGVGNRLADLNRAELANIQPSKGTPVPANAFAQGVLKDLKKVNVKEQGVAEGSLNETSSDEAWELVGQPVPEIQQFVKQMGYGNDEQSVAKITSIIDRVPATQIPAASIPKLKNLANKGNDAQTLKSILQISGRPDAEQQYTKLMQARDAGEGRNRDVSGYIQYVKSGNYDPPVLLKLPTGVYVIGGRTRLYAALALGVPANVKIISANNFKQGVAESTGDLRTELARVYRAMAPGIERHRDSHKAGELYDALEAVADARGAGKELDRMMRGARNSAHMEYDTNPGGFENWFWFLPFATDEQGIDEVKQRLDAKCWAGKHKEGTKIKGGVRVNNCVPNEGVAESYWTKLQNEKNSKLNSLVTELAESLKK